jgi:hypothetical protein
MAVGIVSTNMPNIRLFQASVRVLVVYATLTICALAAVDLYAQTMLPFYRWELGWIAPDYKIEQFFVVRSGGQLGFGVKALGNEYVLPNGHVLPAGAFECSTAIIVMEGLQHVVLVLLVPLAFPGLTWRRRLTSLAFALPILFIAECTDVPLDILGGLDQSRAGLLHIGPSWAAVCFELLSSGGALALALSGGLLACGGGYLIEGILQAKPRARMPKKRRRATQRRPVGGRLKIKQP